VLLAEALARAGHDLVIDADVRFMHLRESTLLGHGQGAFFINRSSARLTARMFQWSPLRIATSILGAPLIPWLRSLKLLAYWRRKGSEPRKWTLRNFLIVTAINYYAVMGQAMGLAFGPGRAGNGYLRYAVDVARPIPDLELIYRTQGTLNAG
jgi:hypothetical protein